MKSIVGIILAAGKGVRMKSGNLPKVLQPICGKPMLGYILDSVRQAGVQRIVVVTGHKADLVKKFLRAKGAQTAKQRNPLGTGDAANCAREPLKGFVGDCLVLYGDDPLITSSSLQRLINRHQTTGASCTILTAMLKNPTGFGRIVRDENGHVLRIVEEQDASLYEKVIEEINAGVYCFKAKEMFQTLARVKPHNIKSEFYLTDTISILARDNRKIESVLTDNLEEIFGVSSKADLIKAHEIIRQRTLDRLISMGATIVDPKTTYIDDQVTVGQDTVIHPSTIIEGQVRIGARCTLGPFCRIRGNSSIADDVVIGNFVEIVRSKIGRDTKISHHTFLGDSAVGKQVNIGAGTITANFDGGVKSRAVICDGASIGCGTIFIAPVKIGKCAVTGAGCVVPKGTEVAPHSVVVGVPAKVLRRKNKCRGKIR